jgi:hypothetical protein
MRRMIGSAQTARPSTGWSAARWPCGSPNRTVDLVAAHLKSKLLSFPPGPGG